jgi:4-amino-4-deoxy-L-arabinose transferase-like glycosyltransferase
MTNTGSTANKDIEKINLAETSFHLYKRNQDSYGLRYKILWVLVICAIGICLRGYFLFQPMRYDESFTFLVFANRGFWDLFNYPLPNNHLLHTIFISVSTSIFGSFPISIRLPSFLAGVASIPLIYLVCQKLGNKESGVIAMLSMAVFPYLVFYSTIARGYSLIVFFTLLLILTGDNYHKRPSVPGCVLISIISAFGMFTMPSMLYVLCGFFLWIAAVLFIKRITVGNIIKSFILPYSAMTFLFSIIFYTPSIIISGGIETIISNRFVRPSERGVFLGKINSHFSEIYQDFSRDVPTSVQIILFVFIIIGIIRTIKEKNMPLALMLISMIFGSGIIFFFTCRIPFVRTWIFILPIVFIIMDSGCSCILERIPRGAHIPTLLVLVILGFCFSFSLVNRNFCANYPDTGHFPDAPLIVEKLSPILSKNDKINVLPPADWPIYFYIWYFRVYEDKNKIGSEMPKEFFIIKKNIDKIEDFTNKAVIKLFDFDNAVVYKAA